MEEKALGNPQAIPLITSDDNGRYTVHDEAVEILNAIPSPLAVIAVAGKWRTGKSFLLNSLLGLNGKPDSFVVGNTVHACTKGLWLWGRPLTLPDGLNVLFVDSEGLGSTSRTQTEDTQIFSLAVLLSSFFIWNSRGVIDGGALEDFGLVVNLTKHIHVRSDAASKAGGGGGGASGTGQTENEGLAEHFPAFLWVVRDFTLRLEANGRAIEDRQYLENALKPQNNLQGGTRNQIRNLLTSFFRTRDCVTLVRPATDEDMLRNLSAQPLENLRPEFVTALADLKKKVFGTVRPKTLNGRQMTGEMLATLTQTYADALNSGGVPTISTAWDRVLENQAAESEGKALLAYTETMGKALAMEPSLLASQAKSAETRKRQLRAPSRSRSSNNGGIFAAEAGSCALPMASERLLEVHAAAKEAATNVFKGSIWGKEQQSTAAVTAATNARLRAAIAAQFGAVDALNWVYSYEACGRVGENLFCELFEGRPEVMGPEKADEDAEASLASWCETFAAACGELKGRYLAEAVGPARDVILGDLLTEKVASVPGEWIGKVTAVERRAYQRLRSELSSVQEQHQALRGKLSAEKDAASREEASLVRASEEALKSTEHQVELAQAQKVAKEEELGRLNAYYERLEEAYGVAVRELETAMEGHSNLAESMEATSKGLAEQIVTHDENITNHSAANGAASDNAVDAAGTAAQLLVEQREVALMHEHAELVKKNIVATKELLAAKEKELEECEFQWGVAKANMAHEEGELFQLKDETAILSGLLLKIKQHLENSRSHQLPSDLVRLLNRGQFDILDGLEEE
mmetsp:Transcript_49410/g.139954  ORF Transcript_49410/g.139954 Transcript_49410/m.139954 type:complete len:806 (-) Transcript_49410:201-2618(-)